MIKIDEAALICDLAETYQIYDYRRLPPTMVAVFSCGLGPESRIKMKLSGQKVPLDTLLMAGINDRLSLLLWAKTKDGQKGKNRPESLVDALTGEKQIKTDEIVSFDSGEEFEKSRAKLLIEMGVRENGN